jgi:predicted nuclease of restriction endonuclease-like (RecB) superfamily
VSGLVVNVAWTPLAEALDASNDAQFGYGADDGVRFLDAIPRVCEAGMDYTALVEAIVVLHQESADRAVLAVNQSLVMRNWMIGAYLTQYERDAADRNTHDRAAADLATRAVGGLVGDLGASTLRQCCQFYRTYRQLGSLLPEALSNSQLPGIRRPVVDASTSPVMPARSSIGRRYARPLAAERVLQLSWTHLLRLMAIEDASKRAFYENEAAGGHWSVQELRRQIDALLYERAAAARHRRQILDNARAQAADKASPANTATVERVRDPLVLQFLGLKDRSEYRETESGAALLDLLQEFVLGLECGLCLEARQKRVTLRNEVDHIDLVFYHRRLRCHVLVDVELRAFRHLDAPRMSAHLGEWVANESEPGDAQPIGLLIWSDRGGTRVEYVLGGIDGREFATRYREKLPSEEALRSEIAEFRP